MESMSVNDAGPNLAKAMNATCESRRPLMITREDGEAVVLMPLREYRSLEETLHLMSSPTNAARIDEAIAEHEAAVRQIRSSTNQAYC
jgi:antitoxin YefM